MLDPWNWSCKSLVVVGVKSDGCWESNLGPLEEHLSSLKQGVLKTLACLGLGPSAWRMYVCVGWVASLEWLLPCAFSITGRSDSLCLVSDPCGENSRVAPSFRSQKGQTSSWIPHLHWPDSTTAWWTEAGRPGSPPQHALELVTTPPSQSICIWSVNINH